MRSIMKKGFAFFILLASCLNVWSGSAANAYILPAEQIIQFMTANFSKTQTLIVDQYCEETSEEKGSRGFQEVLTMKSPDMLHSVIKESEVSKGTTRDHSYRQLFLANSAPRVMSLLLEMGIDIEKVGYTRMDGVIAYRIGEADQSGPKILVEKGRFLPLFLVYKAPGLGGALAKAKFLDYRKVEQAWYPFEILYSTADGITEKCTVRSLRVNRPLSEALFAPK